MNTNNRDINNFLYQKRQKIYPREVHGLYARMRKIAACVLLGLYYGLPWLNWDSRQAILFDLPARQFHLFNLTFWPQDFFYLASLLIIAALSLFFFTALAGRLWCGYACPQTVWTETFMWIERWVEGDRTRQLRRDQSALSTAKVLTKTVKHLLWIAYALFTGFTFVGYFTPIRELVAGIAGFSLSEWEMFWILFYGFATYGNAGWMREQVCIYMCPYARFQSAMFDRDTLIISYDATRGEPRGSRKRTARKDNNLGDCINCSLCVQACPTGIDIRNGLQYQCIGCAACIDACDEVMAKMNYEPGLVRYTTENQLSGRPVRLIRPRVIIYATLLIALFAALLIAIGLRVPLELDIIRDRNVLYREAENGLISNVYTLKILNMDQQPHTYKLQAEGIQGLEMRVNSQDFQVKAGEVKSIAASLIAAPENLRHTSTVIEFVLAAEDDPGIAVREKARFVGPYDHPQPRN